MQIRNQNSNKKNMNMITSIGKFGGLVLTYGENNSIYCVA